MNELFDKLHNTTGLSKEGAIMQICFNVLNRDSTMQPFHLNETQRALDLNLTGRDLVPKARRLGVSTYFLARYTVACLTEQNINAAVISHESQSTMRMLQTVRFFIEHLRIDKRPQISNLSQNRIRFKATNSEFFIGTAGSDNFGRGDTIHRLHCSEYAQWANGQELLSGLLPSVSPTGEIALESTGRGHNDYSRRCFRAAQGRSSWKVHFFDWRSEPAHSVPREKWEAYESEGFGTPDWYREDLGELEVKDMLTPEQIVFRRRQIEDTFMGNVNTFQQEFPLSLSECFQATGRSYFYKVNYQPSDKWRQVGRDEWALDDHPVAWFTYTLGADVGGGVGGDASSIQVFCIQTGEQVYEYNNNSIQPDVFADKIAEVATQFNEAYCTVEANNHGIASLAELVKIYNTGKIYQRFSSSYDEVARLSAYGFYTSVRSKPMALGRLRKYLAEKPGHGGIVVHSDGLKAELDTFIETESGRLEAEEGHHDDRVMASAMAVVGWNNAAALEPEAEHAVQRLKDPFSFESILQGLKDEDEQDGRYYYA